jgi:sugar lactone lactonase YvrE
MDLVKGLIMLPKKLPSLLLAVFIAGCSYVQPNSGFIPRATISASDDIQALEKEYLQFKTKALTESYLARKLESWLGPPAKDSQLLKEVKFAIEKYPDLLKEVMATGNYRLYGAIINNPGIRTYMDLSASFRTFMEAAGPAPEPDFTVSTIAGGDYVYQDGTGTTALFYAPYGMAVDGSGNVYVGDAGNSERIRKIAVNGEVTTLAGNGSYGSVDGTGTVATFREPVAVTVDCDGNIFVADAVNHRVRKIDTGNHVSTIAGSTQGFAEGTDARFRTPQGIAADCNGNVYISDTDNNRIRKIDTLNNNNVTTIGGDGSEDFADGTDSRFANPRGLAVGSDGKIYVADRNNGKIRIIDPDNNYDVSSISGFSSPEAVAVNSSTGIIIVSEPNSNSVKKIELNNNNSISSISGNGGFSHPVGVAIYGQQVYVGDVNHKLIKKIDLTDNNSLITVAGNNGFYLDAAGTSSRFSGPHGIFRDNSGNIFIADTDNQRIRKMDAQGNVTTIAGSGNQAFAPGNGTNASFYNPAALVADSQGNIFVADTGNQRIRKIDLNGEVTTIAGNASQSFTEGNGAAASFSNPFGITIDPQGKLYVADTNNQRIRMIDTSGNVTVIAGKDYGFADGNGTGASFKNPYGITRDNNTGILYVADTENQRIRKIDTNGNVTTLAGSGNYDFADGVGANASFKNPQGIIFNNGNLYIADTDGRRVRKLEISTGKVTTIAGDGTYGYTEGTGTNSSFAGPFAISLDPAGNIYISDVGNNRIRKLAK